MHVEVGSTNPVKIDAVERTLSRFEPTVTAVAVDSGVPEQPWSVDETVTGARNRARRALAQSDADAGETDGHAVGTDPDGTDADRTDAVYGVGLEGGVTRFDGVEGLSLIMWAAVTDGDRIECGGGPAIRLPDGVAERLEDGAELGPVMDDVLGTDGIAESDGAAGVLSDGLTDRTRALGEAVACAFGPFRVSHYAVDDGIELV